MSSRGGSVPANSTDGLLHGSQRLFGRPAAHRCQAIRKAIVAELLALGIDRFGHAVAEHDEQVAGADPDLARCRSG